MEKSCLIYGLERKYFTPAETTKVLQQWMLIFRSRLRGDHICMSFLWQNKYLRYSQKEIKLSLVKYKPKLSFISSVTNKEFIDRSFYYDNTSI